MIESKAFNKGPQSKAEGLFVLITIWDLPLKYIVKIVFYTKLLMIL